jgi:hypothetical protein
MISKAHIVAAALSGVMICSVAGAQMRNGTGESSVREPATHQKPAPKAPASPASPAAIGQQSSSKPASVAQNSSRGQTASGFDPIVSSVSFDGVPGLGFDYPHLAAISRGQTNNSSTRFDHNGHREQAFFVPIWFGGYPYYSADYSYDQPEQQPAQQPQPQPQIIVIQQPVPGQQTAESGVDTGNLSTSASSSQPAEPIPDVGNFILVRRDGRILFASAFSVVGTQLQYVTPEGIRRTVAISEIDPDATQRMNEERGTTVQIHN